MLGLLFKLNGHFSCSPTLPKVSRWLRALDCPLYGLLPSCLLRFGCHAVYPQPPLYCECLSSHLLSSALCHQILGHCLPGTGSKVLLNKFTPRVVAQSRHSGLHHYFSRVFGFHQCLHFASICLALVGIATVLIIQALMS